MAYIIRYNRTSNHITGIETRTTGAGKDMGSHVSYFAESACPSLTRYGRDMAVGKSYETLAEALDAARKAGGRKLCKSCEKAAQAELDALVAAVAELEATPVETEATCANTGVKDARQYKSTCVDCGKWGTVTKSGRLRAHAPANDTKPEETVPMVEPRRAKLNLSNVHVSINQRGEVTLIATDALRGPVEIHMDEGESRWLRACVADMGPLRSDEDD